MPDVITQIYPWKRITVDAWKNGTIPLWNPYSFSGTKHAANYQSAVFSPFTVLYFVLPFVYAWSVLILLQPLLAGIFMLLFLRSIERSIEASLIGSIAFMFCGFITVWMAYGTLAYAALFLPLILFGIETELKLKRKTRLSTLIIPFGVALSFLSGHFQISLYVLLFSFFYAFVRTRTNRKLLFSLCVLLILGVCLAAPQLILTLSAYIHSTRSVNFIKGEVIPWQYIITLLSPDFYGNPVTRNDWFGHYAEWSSYIGIVPLFAALFALISKKDSVMRFFIVPCIVSLCLSYQTPFVDALFALRIPVLSTSAASRIIILGSFSLCVLASFGIDAMTRLQNSRNGKKHMVFVGGIAVGVLIIIWAVLMFIPILPLEKLVVAKRNMLLPTIYSIGAIVGFMIYIRLKPQNRVLKNIILGILVFVTAGDMLRFSTKWMPFEEKQYMYPDDQTIQYLIANAKEARVFGNIGNEVGSMSGIQLIEGYDAMYDSRYGEFMHAVSTGSPQAGQRSVVLLNKRGTYTIDALQLMGVKYIVHRKSDGRNVWAFPFWDYPAHDFEMVHDNGQYEVFEYKKTYPRTFLASSYLVAQDDSDNISKLFNGTTDKRKTLILEQKPMIEPEEGQGTAQIISYSDQTVDIHTSANSPKLLFLSDTYDNGWKVDVDGKEYPLYRADYAFRAVSLPAGDHVVHFYYAPVEMKVGSIVAVIAGLTLFLLLVKTRV